MPYTSNIFNFQNLNNFENSFKEVKYANKLVT